MPFFKPDEPNTPVVSAARTDKCSFPLDDTTPSTIISTLPRFSTPLPYTSGPMIEIRQAELLWHESPEISCPPGAPLMKDYDSFSVGTGGSFGALPDMSQEVGELFYHPPDTLGLSQADADTSNLSIENWREDVFDHALGPPQEAVTRPSPLDLFLWTSQDDTLSVIDLDMHGDEEEDDDDYFLSDDDTPELTPELPPAVPSAAASTSLGASKRARSRSPEPSRRIRIRARSQSLSSIRSYGQQICEGVASAPPWRMVHSRGDELLPPFD